MSKIMVFDVAAESGGALSVLNGFYKEFKENLDNEYIIVVSRPHLSDAANIKVLRYPWVKRSWGHRLYFDNFIAPDLIRKNEVGKVLSLQNIIIPHTRIDQTVLVHNALPFIEYKFSILEDPLLWSYQNVIGRMIFRSIKKATKVIVQTEWMKNACVKRLNIDPVKLEVLPAKINIEVKNRFKPTKESLSTFFYPASGALFKNHRLIIEACRELKHQGIENYTVLFTLKGDENRHIGKLYKSVAANQLPVKFIGSLSRKEVFDYYSKSILIFPSYIESFALPLHEAMAHGAPILATKQLLSREVLGDYESANYFKANDAYGLADLIKKELAAYD